MRSNLFEKNTGKTIDFLREPFVPGDSTYISQMFRNGICEILMPRDSST